MYINGERIAGLNLNVLLISIYHIHTCELIRARMKFPNKTKQNVSTVSDLRHMTDRRWGIVVISRNRGLNVKDIPRLVSGSRSRKEGSERFDSVSKLL